MEEERLNSRKVRSFVCLSVCPFSVLCMYVQHMYVCMYVHCMYVVTNFCPWEVCIIALPNLLLIRSYCLCKFAHSFSYQRSSMFDNEAEEEEEEGLQAGLGDFGFGTTSNIKDRDDEIVSIGRRYYSCVCVSTAAWYSH